MFKNFLITTGLCLSALAAEAQSLTKTCGQKTIDTVSFKWCIDQDYKKITTGQDVVFFFHGAGGGITSWDKTDIYKKVRQEWIKNKTESPAIVQISFDMLWLLKMENIGEQSGLLPFYIEKLLPFIESKIAGPIQKRIVLGESMGGFNAIQLLAYAPDYFDKYMILCPMVPSLSPKATRNERIRFSLSTKHASLINVAALQYWMGKEFPTMKGWSMHSPLELAKSIEPVEAQIQIIYNIQDEFGFVPGTQKFISQLKNNGVEFSSSSSTGKHCKFDSQAIKNIAHFLSTH